jgi:tetratricopeptide (TPR) repeat protein
LVRNAAEKLETHYANGVWLNHAEFDVNIRKLQQGHIQGTCAWFMKSGIYANWRNISTRARKSNMLWIQGKPGSGKSTLASQLVEDLETFENRLLLSVFCKAGEENKSDLESVLRNLLFQLMVKSPKQDEFQSRVQAARLKEKTLYVQSIETVWTLFTEMLTDHVPVYCIVDGIDECTHGLEERREFLDRLSQAFTDGHEENRLMVISRLERSEIQNTSGAWEFLHIRPSDVRQDIQLLVSAKMDRSKTLSVHPEIEQLKTALVEGADGMILWADLMVTELEVGHWDVQSVLNRPPLGLSEIYGNVLRRLSRNKRAMLKARRVLDLVLAVGRPLRNEELTFSLAMMEGLKSHEDYDARGDPVSEGQAILQETTPLLTVMSDDTVQVVHASLRDFLFSYEASSLLQVQFSTRRCNTEASKVFIDYLSFDCFRVESVDSESTTKKPLLDYASNWLTYHVSSATGSKEVANSLVALFKKTQGWKWLQRLGKTYKLSFGHLQLMQSKIRVWTESLDIDQDDKDLLCNFLILLAKSRYEDAKRVEGDTPSQLTLASMIYLASTYYWQGQWKEAEELDSQVLQIKSKILGERHAETLKSMVNLASSYRNQGRWKAAEELQLRALGLMGSIYRDHDPEMLRGKANLTAIWRNQKRLVAAEELQLQTLKARTDLLQDESHPDILTSKANLALTYYDAQKSSDAEKLQEDVLKTSIKSLGSDHPYTLSSMANLAATLRNQGRWRDAAELGYKIVNMRTAVLGEDHPYTLNSTVGLAATLLNQGNFTEAERFQTRVIDLRRKRVGEDHPETLTGMGSLALTYCFQERWAEAEELQVRTLDLVRGRFDDGHPFRLISMTNLVLCYRNQGKWEITEPLLREIEKTIANTDNGVFLGHLADFDTQNPESAPEPPGKAHVSKILAMIEQAKAFAKEHRWTEETNLQFQIMQLRRKVIGEDNPDTLTGMANLSLAGQDQAR